MSVVERTERYAARLDEHLETLTPEARLPFLRREFAKWEDRYNDWQMGIATGKVAPAPLGGPTAHDFILTITEISKRKAQYAAQAVAA